MKYYRFLCHLGTLRDKVTTGYSDATSRGDAQYVCARARARTVMQRVKKSYDNARGGEYLWKLTKKSPDIKNRLVEPQTQCWRGREETRSINSARRWQLGVIHIRPGTSRAAGAVHLHQKRCCDVARHAADASVIFRNHPFRGDEKSAQKWRNI